MSNAPKKTGGTESDKPMETVKTTSIPTKLEYAEDKSRRNAKKRKDND